MEQSSGGAGETTSKPSCIAGSSETPQRPLARYCRFVKFEDLERWEAKGWKAISHYKHASDDIQSVMIGWFDDAAPPSEYINSRHLAFFDDGSGATLSIMTEQLGHLYIKITNGQARLLNADLGTYLHKAASQ